MSKERKNKIVPELRFPEFENEGEWEDKKLAAIGEPLMCKRIFKEQTTSNNKNGIPFYKIGTFGGQADSYITKERYNDFKSKYPFPKIGDILISASGTIGRLVIYDGSPAYFQDSNIVWLGNDEEKMLNRFLFHCYSRLKWQTSDGGVIRRLYNSDLKNMRILFPSGKQEQQKIASCLSSLDDLTTAENQKLEALKAHKKGLMQQLFPAEGKKVPELRFGEFKESGEWKKISLIDVADKNVKWSFTGGPFGSNLKASDYVTSSDAIRVIQLQNIGDGEFLDDYKIFTSEEKADELLSCNIYPGDIVLSKMGDPVGRACIIPNSNNRYVMCSDGIRLVVDEKEFDKYFVFTLINSNQFRSLVEKTSTGSTRKRIGLDDLKNLPMLIPRKLGEQQKIASCLSSLAKVMTAQAEKIEALKEHKKGLMQALFPELKEINE